MNILFDFEIGANIFFFLTLLILLLFVGGENALSRLRRGNGNLGGVCTGIAEVLRIPVWVCRLGFVIAALTGCGVLPYLLLWIFIPRR